MARIEVRIDRPGRSDRQARVRFGPRMMKKMTGRDPQTGNGIEPIEIWAHQPKMMVGMGRFDQAVRKGKTVDERIRNLVELKGAQMIGASTASTSARRLPQLRLPDAELLALPRYRPATCSPIARRRRWTTRSR